MIRKLLAHLYWQGANPAGSQSSEAEEARPLMHQPYNEAHTNFLYNLLFCDDPSLFQNARKHQDGTFWSVVLADEPDIDALQQIASDPEQESRVRALAYNRIRAAGHAVPSKVLLGVIIEVPLELGLDTLAAYVDGRARYLNQSGKVAIYETGPPEVAALAKELVAASQAVVDVIGPWEDQRLPPPQPGNVRMTFLVSDGLYFGDGPFEILRGDPMGGPVLAKAEQLLIACVDGLEQCETLRQ